MPPATAAGFPRISRTVGDDDDRDFSIAVTAIITGFCDQAPPGSR